MKSSRLKKFAVVCAGLLAAGIAGRAVFFKGPYVPAVPLPSTKLLDVHCHTAGIGGGNSGCFTSKALTNSYKFDIYLKSFGTTRAEIAEKGDAILFGKISTKLAESREVGEAVILAMDGVVDAQGNLDRDRTEVYVPNEYVATETAKFTNLWFGASVNPLRHDAIAQLDWCASHGAVLVKWIPSIMQFDPSDERIIPFYKRLIHHGIPLLCHAGQERSFSHAKDELCDPEKLALPLRLGVRLIAAHIASTGSNGGERDTDRLARLMGHYTNLYSEISSITQVNKLGYLREALTRKEFAGRLCYGSDFPLINTPLVSPWYFPLNLTRTQMQEISAMENPWDRDVAIKQALGVPTDVFTRSRELVIRHK